MLLSRMCRSATFGSPLHPDSSSDNSPCLLNHNQGLNELKISVGQISQREENICGSNICGSLCIGDASAQSRFSSGGFHRSSSNSQRCHAWRLLATGHSLSLENDLTRSLWESLAVVLNSSACVSVPLVRLAVPRWARASSPSWAYSGVVNSIVKQTPAGNFFGKFFFKNGLCSPIAKRSRFALRIFFRDFCGSISSIQQKARFDGAKFLDPTRVFFQRFFFCS